LVVGPAVLDIGYTFVDWEGRPLSLANRRIYSKVYSGLWTAGPVGQETAMKFESIQHFYVNFIYQNFLQISVGHHLLNKGAPVLVVCWEK